MYLGPWGSVNRSEISSRVFPAVSGNMKKTCTNMETPNTPNKMYVCHLMFTKAGGTKYPRAKLKAQFPEVARATAFPRTRSGYSSGGIYPAHLYSQSTKSVAKQVDKNLPEPRLVHMKQRISSYKRSMLLKGSRYFPRRFRGIVYPVWPCVVTI